MRYGMLSDIHGNLEALDAVLEALADESIDRFLCLGDIVGYGANPNECLDRVSALTSEVIAGNHDHAAIGKLDITAFNQFAAEAALWTMRQLTPAGRRYLGELPYTRRIDDLYAVHASPSNPEGMDLPDFARASGRRIRRAARRHNALCTGPYAHAGHFRIETGGGPKQTGPGLYTRAGTGI